MSVSWNKEKKLTGKALLHFRKEHKKKHVKRNLIPGEQKKLSRSEKREVEKQKRRDARRFIPI